MTKKKYIKRTPNEPVSLDRIGQIAKDCNTYPVLVSALLNRDFSEEEVKEIICSDEPAKELIETPLRGTDKAAEHILKHLNKGDSIGIFADYDCDGITSGYVMYSALKDIARTIKSSSTIYIHYPQRKSGYGLNLDYCKKAVSNGLGLIITVDNGISVKKEQQFLKENGVELIVTDHHEPIKSNMPDCIIVDPCYSDIERSYLAGVAVAYNLVSIIANRCWYTLDKNKYLPPVAIGTISDCMPMSFENASYIKQGLQIINSGNSCKFLQSYVNGILSPVDVSFTIAPRINAASRIGDVRTGAVGFFTDDDKKLKIITKKLEDMNNERKATTSKARKVVAKIKEPKHRIVSFNGIGYGKGLHGIIAGEIAKRFEDYPSFVYSIYPDSNDENKKLNGGSVRCANESVDCMELFLLLKKEGLVKRAAGHANACVLEVEEGKFDKFQEAFDKLYDAQDFPVSITGIDAQLSLKAAFSADFFEKSLKIPFTTQEEPIYGISNVCINRYKYSMSNKDNIMFTFADSTAVKNVWGWGWSKKYKELGYPKEVHLVCSIVQDFRFNDVSPTLKILDMIPVR